MQTKMSTKKFSSSIDGGHDAVYDYTCTPCENDGLNAEALFYCKDYSKLLCKQCEKNHNRFFMGHNVLGQRYVHSWGSVKRTTAVVMCEEHPGKEVEMFCKDHDCVCCLVCVNVTHRFVA